MPDSKFEVLIRSGDGPGAGLSAVLKRLQALQSLYVATAVAQVRPGGSGQLPKAARELADLRIEDADPAGSLNFSIAEPAVEHHYDHEFAIFAPKIRGSFRSALRAASRFDADEFADYFPMKSDQVRILRSIESFAPDEHEYPVSVKGLGGDVGAVVLRAEHREWAGRARPSLAPETVEIPGMIRGGNFGVDAKFRLYDGSNSVLVVPDEKYYGDFQSNFGKVVTLSGTAHYDAFGRIAKISNITNVAPYYYSANRIRSGSREFHLTSPIIYNVSVGLDTKTFTLSNDLIGAHCFGRSLKDAIEVAAFDFSSLWDEIAQPPEQDIHPSALRIRKALIDLVTKVETHNV